jgi:hypothetical protein
MFSYIRHKTGCKICGFTKQVVNINALSASYYYVHKKVHEKLDAHSIIQFWLTCPKLRAWHAEFWMAHARVLKFYWLDFSKPGFRTILACILLWFTCQLYKTWFVLLSTGLSLARF